ncbi:hypothetical protein CR513_42156, partial [Mucuna pruriens]
MTEGCLTLRVKIKELIQVDHHCMFMKSGADLATWLESKISTTEKVSARPEGNECRGGNEPLDYLRNINIFHAGTDRILRQLPPITFTDQDFIRFNLEQNNMMISEAEMRPDHEQLVDTSYNVLIDRPTLNTLDAIVSTPLLVMKLPPSNGQVVIAKAEQKMAWECYIDSLRVMTRPPKEDNILTHVEISTNIELDPRPPIDQGAEPHRQT